MLASLLEPEDEFAQPASGLAKVLSWRSTNRVGGIRGVPWHPELGTKDGELPDLNILGEGEVVSAGGPTMRFGSVEGETVHSPSSLSRVEGSRGMAGLADNGHVVKVGDELGSCIKLADGLKSLLKLSPSVDSKAECSQNAPLVQPSLSQDVLPAA